MQSNSITHSVHIFAEDPNTYSTFEDVCQNKYFSSANFVLKYGGIDAATQLYKDVSTPNVLIIQTKLRSDQLMGALGALAENCDMNTQVFLVLAKEDQALKAELIEMGISDVFFPPVQSEHISNALQAILPVSEIEEKTDGAIAFVSVRPGAGASTISHNLAWYLGIERNEKTILADFDIMMGTVGLNYFRDPFDTTETALLEASKGKILGRTLRGYAAEIEGQLSLLVSGANLAARNEIENPNFNAVSEGLCEEYDKVILDYPSHWSMKLKESITICEQLVLVATPDLASLRNAKSIMTVLSRSKTKPKIIHFVLNKVGEAKRKSIREEDFEDTLEMPVTTLIPYDPFEVSQMEINGQTILSRSANCQFSKQIRVLGEHISEQHVLRFEEPEEEVKPEKTSAILSIFNKLASKKM